MTAKEKMRVLFVTQEITPYMKESHLGLIGRYLPQGIQEKGREIRTFMPRFGTINERRNQLHEVIRLSGMNIVINDADHPLIIKVASIQSARMQIYFIDNEDYFHRKSVLRDKNNVFYEDNDERAVFYSRGVIETVKKLGWAPSIIHCHGWLSSILPFYIKTAYHENPIFSRAKVIFSLYDDAFPEPIAADFHEKIRMEGVPEEKLPIFSTPDYYGLMQGAITMSDALIIGSPTLDDRLMQMANASGKPILPYQPADSYINTFDEFYEEVLQGAPVTH
ncbi:MAG TPA: glycogen/starch synthase [Bacteroidales bacterium]|nr:glycogen/starch synthase [Bacteroidales bacterium]HRZ48189.1 glycogen/starch synthase [Bacteroidales bacterium]